MSSLTASGRSQAFIDSVLQLNPRIATFDCDGTLWSGDAGESFFSWEIEEKLVPEELGRKMRARYADYKRGKVEEDVMCGEMVTMHGGMIEADVQRMATRFFDLHFVERIFPEMRSLVRELIARGCDVWAVSSTNEWVIRAGMRHFGIARDHVLAAAASIEDLRITDRVIRIPSGDGKPAAIRAAIKANPDAAFGNSRWDADMLAIARYPFAVNPSPDLEQAARQRGWSIYFP
ncbi:MAG TPA: haloacid dehalogenase-like hydrolase, partial [Terriglobales bacterium]|nr:haloacid dehalogenase-like hydrolase [Terriglobales bacterium]